MKDRHGNTMGPGDTVAAEADFLTEAQRQEAIQLELGEHDPAELEPVKPEERPDAGRKQQRGLQRRFRAA